MKKLLISIVIILSTQLTFGQLLSWTPEFTTDNSGSLVITMDANYGNNGLLNYSSTGDVYVHTGVITNLSTSNSDWKYVKFSNFSAPDPSVQTTYLGSNKWQFTINPTIRAFYGVPVGETILRIAILFRSGNGSKVQRNTDGSDMYIPISTTALDARLKIPFKQPKYNMVAEPISKNVGDNITISGTSNNSSALKLYFNGAIIQTAAAATTISSTATVAAPGNQTIVLEANDGSSTKNDTIQFFVSGTTTIAALPSGVRDGINYEADNSAVTLVLYAPGKSRVAVIGDLPGSNWTEKSLYEFKKTPDGNYWWLRITGLTSGTEYSYQYLVDGSLKIADPYTEKILDPNNDQFISSQTYPNLKSYPTNSTSGIVSTLQTGQTPYNWHVNSFSRPDKRSLLVYELHVRDFVAKHDWNTMIDTLGYLKTLGINTIELMPVNEFEGNSSWGYNPDFYFAPDKYYGPANTFKKFIDSCHSKGIAVVMDMVLNHSFGSSPMVQLYYDNVNNRPAANNPWYNAVATHPFNVGFQFNHESLATRYFSSRVMEHWLTNYKVDGFRFDLSKGFTQTNTGSDVNAWSQYDASRVAIWKRYYDTMQLKSPNSYTILEHFAVNSEELELSNYGMMLWGNLNYSYNQASMGYSNGWNFDQGIFTNRGWNNPSLVTYMESHDEERQMYRNENFGNALGGYDTKQIATGLKREEMNGAFFFTAPGPKMIWQFGELGYDYSINTCGDLTINNNCRLDPKPIRWDYFQDANRKSLFNVWSKLMGLRAKPLYRNTFTTNRVTQDFSGNFKWMVVNTDTSNIVVIGNYDVSPTNGSVTFPSAGTYYDYFSGTNITATGASQSFFLQPGEYHVYLNRSSSALPVTIVSLSGNNNVSSNTLSWTITNEINVVAYEIERSTDGLSFGKIGSVNSSGKSDYTFNDDHLSSNVNLYFYRLRSIDKDGKSAYSEVVKIKSGLITTFVEASPNPFNSYLSLSIYSDVATAGNIRVSDISGRTVLEQKSALNKGGNRITIHGSEPLSAGTYLVTVKTETEIKTIRVVKN
ncbi:MAG: hypothetical protein NVSMB45_00570 [Ginsengibacter sp.]